jgi:hypothetical protein
MLTPVSSLAVIGALPEQFSVLKTLADSEFFLAASLGIIGVLLLIFGFKAHRWIVVLNCIALGYFVGGMLGDRAQIATVGGIVGAVVLGAISWPLMKYAVAVSGGLVGAIVGMGLWVNLGQPESHRWAGALIGLVVLGMLSFTLFKASVILFSCIQGATMVVLGSCAMLMKYKPWEEPLYANLTNKPVLMPVLIFAVALLGIIYQHHHHGFLGDGSKGSPSPAGGDAKKK